MYVCFPFFHIRPPANPVLDLTLAINQFKMQFPNTISHSLRVICAIALITLITPTIAAPMPLSHTMNYPVSGPAPESLSDELPHTELSWMGLTICWNLGVCKRSLRGLDISRKETYSWDRNWYILANGESKSYLVPDERDWGHTCASRWVCK